MSELNVTPASISIDIDEYIDSGEDDIWVTMTTRKPHLMDRECVVVEDLSSKKNKKRKRKVVGDCVISRISHDPSHDNDVQCLSVERIKTTSRTTILTPSSPDSPQSLHKSQFSTPSLSCLCSLQTTPTNYSPLQQCVQHTCRSKQKRKRAKSQHNITTEGIVLDSKFLSPNDKEASLFISSSSAPLSATLTLPSWWCEGDNKSICTNTAFSLIELDADSCEAKLIMAPLIKDGFKITVIQRIQSPSLWRRYMGEVRLFLEERGNDVFLNEKLLYHCSRAKKEVICAEGLDARLSSEGLFGKGIYFSDKPRKCNYYCHSKPCYMFGCKVILGDTKSYSTGQYDRHLTREPQKPDGTYHDSVLGFVSVGEEYVIYNNYRAVPFYYIEYTVCTTVSHT